MWHSGQKYTSEEKEVLRELEYEMFMYNPGFRSMWNDNFEKYFEATLDEEKWIEHHNERYTSHSDDMGLRMIEDPEFAKFMRDQCIIDEVLMGEMKLEHAPFELQQEIQSIMQESEEINRDFEVREILGIEPEFVDEEEEEKTKNPLYKIAREWGEELSLIVRPLYEQTKDVNLFRILTNCGIVASKVIGAGEIDYSEMDKKNLDFAWRIDRSDFSLAVISLRRCLESLEVMLDDKALSKKLEIPKYLETGREIKQQLIDRLDAIELERFKR